MSLTVSVVLPCRDEMETIGACIETINKAFQEHDILGEVVVSDSSSDGSSEIARGMGAVVVKHDKVGYGVACIQGMRAAKGKYIILGDADGTYDFSELPLLLDDLKKDDIVIGTRFRGKIMSGAMPALHRYIGNPMLSFILNLVSGTQLSDAHCGLRGIRKEAFEKLNLKASGMEFASEMIIKAARKKMRIGEVPVSYHTRLGESKLKSLSDGYRHLRFMLLYGHDLFFLLPGLIMFLAGFIILMALVGGPIQVKSVVFYTHPMVLGSLLAILGYQVILSWLYAKTFMISAGLEDSDPIIDRIIRYFTLERASIIGLILFTTGFLINLKILFTWFTTGFGELSEIKTSIFASTLMVVGVQSVFSAILLSVILLRTE